MPGNYAPVLHEATDEGHIAGRNATSSVPECYVRRTRLAIVFSDPDIAVVGRRFSILGEGEAIIGEADFARQGRTLAAATNRGILRVYADRVSGSLLGAGYAPPRASTWPTCWRWPFSSASRFKISCECRFIIRSSKKGCAQPCAGLPRSCRVRFPTLPDAASAPTR